MDCIATRIPYRQTNNFSRLVLDYIDGEKNLRPFYSFAPSLSGIREAIQERKVYSTDRPALVARLKEQYAGLKPGAELMQQIELLNAKNTFTVTTAHQNNLFTGPLYFIYKIVHVIRLARHFQANFPGENFIPVFYMGSEDADLDELNHIHLGGEKLVWNPQQSGAVGRMIVDRELLQLIDRLEGQLAVWPFGAEIVSALREAYQDGVLLQDATFRFVNFLFGRFGLLVLIADDAVLKKQALTVFEDDIFCGTASRLVEASIAQLSRLGYPGQANPRDINLFYLKDNLRERIEKKGDRWVVLNSSHQFTEKELREEIKTHPERFSPNVILRGLYQEMLLPNICFVGGGGELAYWLQLKPVFDHYKVPFPVLSLRNSYLVVEKSIKERIAKLGLSVEDFFGDEESILSRYMQAVDPEAARLNGSTEELLKLYDSFRVQASKVDPTLDAHVISLQKKAEAGISALQKKMLRAKKRKFSDQRRQIKSIESRLFPANGLQERHENITYFYARWGPAFIDRLQEFACALEHEFCVLEEV
jgi:bacillithiol biosynthesis cysteine-adding enzyme BshC